MPRWLRIVGAALATAAAGCGALGGDEAPRDGLAPDTARFTYGDRTVEIPLHACGQEDDTVLMAGARGATVLQVEADVGEGGLARTGVTVEMGAGEIWGAFGPDMQRPPAGTVREVRTEGDRLVVEATWAFHDGDLRATAPGQTTEGRLVARCPEPDDDVS